MVEVIKCPECESKHIFQEWWESSNSDFIVCPNCDHNTTYEDFNADLIVFLEDATDYAEVK